MTLKINVHMEWDKLMKAIIASFMTILIQANSWAWYMPISSTVSKRKGHRMSVQLNNLRATKEAKKCFQE